MGGRITSRIRGLLKPRVALVLGGGGARGFAHLGVLKVLEQEKVPVDLIVGCSAGALIGTLYAFSGSTEAAERGLVEFSHSPGFSDGHYRDIQAIVPLAGGEKRGLFSRLHRAYKMASFFASTLLKESFVHPKEFERNVAAVIPDRRLEESPIPLAIVATDLKTGEEVVLREGPARLAVQASSAIAGVFPPVQVGRRDLVDGGFVDKVPVEVAIRLGADVVLAVNVGLDVDRNGDVQKRGATISARANAIMSEALTEIQTRFADVLICPDVQSVHWADFRSVERAVPLGEAAARKAMPQVRKALRRGWRRKLVRIVGRWPRRTVVFRPLSPSFTPALPEAPPAPAETDRAPHAEAAPAAAPNSPPKAR
ncbi:MAG: patatin-like phospholipase family protein [Acidobacteriota bacterium]